jgi:hypothetical protein
MDCTVAMAWRPAPDRMAAYKLCLDFWSSLGLPVVHADSDPDTPFNVSQARNRTVAAVDTEFVVVADADAILAQESIVEALDTCEGEVIWPYDSGSFLPAELIPTSVLHLQLDRLRDAPTSAWHRKINPDQMAWITVCRTETYWRLGGFDERLPIWAGEDSSFLAAAATLTGGRRLPGRLISFDHSSDFRRDEPVVCPLRQRYIDADGDPAAMEALVAEAARGFEVTPQRVTDWKSRWPSPPPGRNWI